jgi:hypothetical protein
MLTGVPVPFQGTARIMKELVATLDSLKVKFEADRESVWKVVFTGTPEHRKLIDSITQLEVQLMYELDAMPIWFVTKRRAYSIDLLINNAEEILEASDLPFLSKTTIYDIREAGKALAFSVPTAAGFHAVRCVEGVARGYHEIIVGVRPSDGTPLGPLVNALRTARDSQLARVTIYLTD